jgi:hypothetical protein
MEPPFGLLLSFGYFRRFSHLFQDFAAIGQLFSPEPHQSIQRARSLLRSGNELGAGHVDCTIDQIGFLLRLDQEAIILKGGSPAQGNFWQHGSSR